MRRSGLRLARTCPFDPEVDPALLARSRPTRGRVRDPIQLQVRVDDPPPLSGTEHDERRSDRREREIERRPAILCRDGPHRPLGAVRRIEQDRLDVAGERRARLLLLERRVRDEVQVAAVLAPVEGEELVVLEREVRLDQGADRIVERVPEPAAARAGVCGQLRGIAVDEKPAVALEERTAPESAASTSPSADRILSGCSATPSVLPPAAANRSSASTVAMLRVGHRRDQDQLVLLVADAEAPVLDRRVGQHILVQVVEVVMEPEQRVGDRVEPASIACCAGVYPWGRNSANIALIG